MQAALDEKLVRWRRMSADLGSRIELGGNGVAAIKQQETQAADGMYELVDPEPEQLPEPTKSKSIQERKNTNKNKHNQLPKPPPPPSALDVAKAQTRKQVQGVNTIEVRKMGPFVMSSAEAHVRLDVPGQSRLLQRRQMATPSAGLKVNQGWGGYSKAVHRPMGRQSKSEREQIYSIKTGTHMKLPNNRRAGPEASATPALVLRNEVARRQRLRARLLAADARVSTLHPSDSKSKPRISIGPR